MAKNPRIFGYARVSTQHQSTDRQLQALEDYGIPRQDIFIDKQSGKDFERRGYLLLKEKILRAGDTLVIKELDRLGRNKVAVKEELEYFRENGIRVKILNVPTTLIDCEGQGWVMDMVGNILIEVMSSMAEEERVKNHQRQREGIEAARARGVQFGRPRLRKPENYEDVMQRVAEGTIKTDEAMEQLGLKRSSYYKLKKLYLAEGVQKYAGVH
jgi:Site-specific recombinases, DNA invertase Pin homologs